MVHFLNAIVADGLLYRGYKEIVIILNRVIEIYRSLLTLKIPLKYENPIQTPARIRMLALPSDGREMSIRY
jgi:hypothetical protein